MASNEDPREHLRQLYREGLGKCGFAGAALERGLGMLESDEYSGFADVVSMLQIFEPSGGARQHQVEYVVQHVTAQEARVKVTTHGMRAAGRVAARQAQEAADRDAELRRARELVEAHQALAREMTADEYEGRAPLRPHIAEALRELTGWTAMPLAPGSRPSWVGRSPAPKARESKADPLRIVEGDTSTDPAAATVPAAAGAADLAETFQEAFGLSEEAAKRAAKGR
jgi:hypothetical protein